MMQKKSPTSAATGERGVDLGFNTLSCNCSFFKSLNVDFSPGAVAPLGITVKSPAVLPGEGQKISLNKDALLQLRKRYRLRIYSQNLLAGTNTILYKSQYYSCRRHKIKKLVVLSRSWSTGKGAIRNLSHCGSVWSCPTCSPVIQHFRTQEITHAVKEWFSVSSEHVTYFLTLTHPHTRDQKLSYLWERQKKALSYFWGIRSVKNCKSLLGYVGRITGTEVTSGNPKDCENSGWHPHQHILIFGKMVSGDQLQKIKERLLSAWIDSLVKVGLCESSEKSLRNARLHSLRLELVTNAEKYISKLGNEIGEPNVKSGRGSKRYMPFDILASAESGEDWAKAAWIEYYLVTKGKRQLVWSDGLKARFKVQEYSDQELADWRAERDFENLFGFEDWEAIRKLPEVEACLEHVLSCGAYQKLRDFFQKIGITLITDKSILDSEVEKPLKEQY